MKISVLVNPLFCLCQRNPMAKTYVFVLHINKNLSMKGLKSSIKQYHVFKLSAVFFKYFIHYFLQNTRILIKIAHRI